MGLPRHDKGLLEAVKKILLRSRKAPFDVISPENTLARDAVGTNAGNLIFSHAVHKFLLTQDTEVVSTRFRADPNEADRINAEYDAFVIPLANAFRKSFEPNLNRLTDLISRLKIPVTIFGVGAQTDVNYDHSKMDAFRDSVKAFCKAALDHGPTIGVRGELTEDYLKALGFKDIDVIGCPSMFLHGEDGLSVDKRVPQLDASSKVSINISPYVKEMGDIVMSHHAKYPNLVYIGQDLDSLSLLLWGDKPGQADKQSDIPVNTSHPMYRENKIRWFVDPYPWIDFLSGFDFAFGTRIHGNVAALLAGTPAVVLAHDSRTLELCRYFEIPYKLIGEVPGTIDARDLYAEADYSGMLGGHKARFARMVEFMDRHGLDHIFKDGRTSTFEEQMRATRFPPPVETLAGADQLTLIRRMGWLKDHTDKQNKKVDELTKKLDAVERATKKLTKSANAASRAKSWPLARKVAKKLGIR